MSKSETQYVLYEIPFESVPDTNGNLSTSLISTSLPLPPWLSGNSVIFGSGLFVIYYSVSFCSCTSCALYQNEFEIPATRVRGIQNNGYVILSTEGRMKTHIHFRASESKVKKGLLLIAELSFHEEKNMVE